jgi:hypothetical protein
MLFVLIMSTRASSCAPATAARDRHLVAVEVGVEGRADERVQLDRLALDQRRLEGLDAEAVQRRRPVQHHRVLADDLVQDVPDLRLLLLDELLRLLDGGGEAAGVELGVDERLEQLERHLLRQAALVQLQLRADHDDRAARVVDALAEQVLPEAALLALQHVGERLQRRLLAPVMTRPRRPLSNSASTASWSMRFSLRMMMSGARSSMSASGGCCG